MVRRRLEPQDYGLIADQRINEKLKLDTIKGFEDYKKQVQELLGTDKGLGSNNTAIAHMFENSKAKEIAERNLAQVREDPKELRKAQQLHSRRTRRSRLLDEKTTSRDTRLATRKSLKFWQKRRFRGVDIRGVDTKGGSRSVVTKTDVKLLDRGIQVLIDRRGTKRYKNLKTGKFIKKP